MDSGCVLVLKTNIFSLNRIGFCACHRNELVLCDALPSDLSTPSLCSEFSQHHLTLRGFAATNSSRADVRTDGRSGDCDDDCAVFNTRAIVRVRQFIEPNALEKTGPLVGLMFFGRLPFRNDLNKCLSSRLTCRGYD